MPKQKTIEETILELESIVKKVEEDDIPIDEIVKIYEHGAATVLDAKKKLQKIINRIELVTERVTTDEKNENNT